MMHILSCSLPFHQDLCGTASSATMQSLPPEQAVSDVRQMYVFRTEDACPDGNAVAAVTYSHTREGVSGGGASMSPARRCESGSSFRYAMLEYKLKACCYNQCCYLCLVSDAAKIVVTCPETLACRC